LFSVEGVTTVAPIVGEIAPERVAERDGLQEEKEINAVDGHRVTSWRHVNMSLYKHAGEQGQVALEISREGSRGVVSGPINGWSLSNDTPNPLAEFGITPWRPDVPAILGQVNSDGRAMEAGLQPGDHVVAVDGEPVADWFSLVDYIRNAPEQ